MPHIDIDGLKITGSEWSVDIQTRAHSYHYIGLELTNVTAENVTDIEVKINGKTIMEFDSGKELNEFMRHYDRVPSVRTDQIDLWFARPELEDKFRFMTSIGTLDVGSFVIKGKLAGSPVSPAIQPFADVGIAQPLGMFTRIERLPHSAANAGRSVIDNLPVNGDIVALHILEKLTTQVDDIKVKYNRVTEKEGSTARWGKIAANDKRVAIPDTHSLSWIGSNNPLEAYSVGPLKLNLELDYNATPADRATDIIVESLSSFGG